MVSQISSIDDDTHSGVAAVFILVLNCDRVNFRIEKAVHVRLPFFQEFSFVVELINRDSELEFYL